MKQIVRVYRRKIDKAPQFEVLIRETAEGIYLDMKLDQFMKEIAAETKGIAMTMTQAQLEKKLLEAMNQVTIKMRMTTVNK